MEIDDQKFMSLAGLLTWGQAALDAVERHKKALAALRIAMANEVDVGYATRAMRSEIHLFLIAAYKVVQFSDWAEELAFLDSGPLRLIDPFRQEIKSLRDMNEHAIEYFRGGGRARAAWVHHGEDVIADASSLAGSKIGGRLDYELVCASIKEMISRLPQRWLPPHSKEEHL